jgi:hypothetical protein
MKQLVVTETDQNNLNAFGWKRNIMRLNQAWASMVINGEKTVETRVWK